MKALSLIPLTCLLLAACSSTPAVSPSPSPATSAAPSEGSTPSTPDTGVPALKVSFAEIQPIIKQRCFQCHGNGQVNGGVSYDNPADIQSHASRIKFRVVDAKNMPQGNVTGMTDQERELIRLWVEQGASLN